MEKNVLVAVTGSVAAIKVPELVQKLVEYQDIKVHSYITQCIAFYTVIVGDLLPILLGKGSLICCGC